jgi:Tol biopolymer transport system component
VRSAGLAAVALLLVLATPAAAIATFPGRNGRLAYGIRYDTYSDDDPSDYWIRTVQLNGSRARQIAPNGGQHPAFSPRGARIAYTSYVFRTSGGLITERASGSGRARRLTHRKGDEAPAWSPSGRRLVFVREDDLGLDSLWIHYFRGSRFLTRGHDPDWSVKGDIVFSGDSDSIWVIRPDGSGLRQLPVRGIHPEWSPDGRRIVFSTYFNNFDIASVRADGTGFRRLTRGPAKDWSPAFSPDGRQIAFIRTCAFLRRLNSGCVVTMNTTGRRLRVVVNRGVGPYEHGGLDWQPLPAVP